MPKLLKTEMGSTEYEAHEATVNRALPIVKKRITELYNYHLQDTNNPKIVGHYPELRTAFGKEAVDAGSGVSYPDDPFSQTKRFEIIIKAVKSVVDKGDATWGKEA